MNLKQLKETLQPDERAVSPVIGVILMVAITVILAAVIGTFVLNLGSNVKQNPQAGVSFEQTGSGNDGVTVTVTLTSVQRADSFTVSADENAGTDDTGNTEVLGTSVGNTADVTDLSPTDKVIVTATYQGNEVVIATYTVSG